jgi:hypothetical protein
MSEPETIEVEVAEELTTALEVAAPAPVNLFRTDDPTEVIRRATAVAETLKDVLVKQGLISRIKDRDHVRVEGWTLCGTMLGVFPVCTWTRKVEDGWEARVEARTLSGAVVGAAEAECLRSENTWKSRDDYALRSMAQTRATSKAMRQPLGFIVQLAGFDPTPAEEVGSTEQRKEFGLAPFPTPRSWAKVREWYEKDGGAGAWELAEAFIRAASYHLYGETDSKKLTPDQRKVMLQKAAGATVWLAENENTPMGSTPSVDHYRKAWAHVLDGTVLEVPDASENPASDSEIDDEAERLADETISGPSD